MDEIDIEILKILQQDARKSLSEISGKVNLSLPAVSERVRRLERSGVIKGYTTILNPEKFGKPLRCFCSIILRNKNPKNDKLFHDFISKEPDILECHCVTGEYEYILKILTETTSSLESLLVRIRNEAPVIKTSTYITLATIKENASVSPEVWLDNN